MKTRLRERSILFLFFISIIVFGTILLILPFSWSSEVEYTFVDALFTSVSAVCVTGLATVDITGMTLFGKVVLLILIQIGGLGLITFSSMFLALPRQKLSIASSNIIKNYFTNEEIVNPKYIIRIVLKVTLSIELLGAIFLYFGFKDAGIDNPVFNSIFHSVSAFCNAGFSTIDGGLVVFRDNPFSSIVFMAIIITGGLGFMVLYDLFDLIRLKDFKLLLHTKIMLLGTVVLIFSGALFYYIFEFNNETMAGLQWYQKIIPAFFQSVTTRTAGFNTIDQGAMSLPSKVITLGYMLIGGGSGSTAGGLKVTTGFLLVCVLYQGLDEKRGITIFNRRIDSSSLTRAAVFFGKAIVLLFITINGILIVESFYGNRFSFMEVTFESFSALATVGVSLGITSNLSIFSKIILIFTMFAGRIGLFSLILPTNIEHIDRKVNYPPGEVLIG